MVDATLYAMFAFGSNRTIGSYPLVTEGISRESPKLHSPLCQSSVQGRQKSAWLPGLTSLIKPVPDLPYAALSPIVYASTSVKWQT